MSTEEIVQRARLLDSEIKVARRGLAGERGAGPGRPEVVAGHGAGVGAEAGAASEAARAGWGTGPDR